MNQMKENRKGEVTWLMLHTYNDGKMMSASEAVVVMMLVIVLLEV
jgi:hypothetical protein